MTASIIRRAAPLEQPGGLQLSIATISPRGSSPSARELFGTLSPSGAR